MTFRTEIIGDQTLILGDCREVMPTLGRFDACVTDPPYGMNWNTDSTRFTGGGSPGIKRDRIIGDNVEFNPLPFFEISSKSIFWGANHFAKHLPIGKTLIWLKQQPQSFGTFLSDAEIGWSSGGNGVWAFFCPRSISTAVHEGLGRVAHPTQKPLEVMRWCLGFVPDAGTILDPFMGSGTTLVACQQLGRKGTGIEISEKYFDIACKRVEQAAAQPRLFTEPAQKPKQEVML